MSYRDTARNFVQAEMNNHPAHGGVAVESLRMSDWGEQLRDTMTPQTIAANHVLHVSDCAEDLRTLLAEARPESGWALSSAQAVQIATAARALLAAIGEGEGA